MSALQYLTPGIAPGDVLEYSFIGSDWLVSGDSIVSASVAGSPFLTFSSALTSGDTVTVWVSNAVVENSYTLTCQIVTAGGRTEGRSAVLSCTTL